MANAPYVPFEPNTLQGTTRTKVSADAFFNNLSIQAEKVANKVAKERAKRMRDTLRYRRSMYAGARYPKWKGTGINKGSRPKGSHAHQGWDVTEYGRDRFYLTNTHHDGNGFSYAQVLNSGRGWGPNASISFYRGKSVNLVRGDNGRIFSKQMPRGIQPFIDIQREKMKADIKEAIGALDG